MPPSTIKRVVSQTLPEKKPIVEDKSPKSVAFPVEATVTLSTLFRYPPEA